MDRDVPDRRCQLVQREGDSGGRTGLQLDLLEAAQHLGRLACAGRVAQVQLRHLGANDVAGVGQREGDSASSGVDVQVGVAERGVRQAVAKGESRLDVLRVIVAV